jgi:hypothetical protein
MPSSRCWLGLALAASIVAMGAGPRAARADIPAGAGTLNSEIRIPDPTVVPPKPPSYRRPSTTEALFEFNVAHCLCSADQPAFFLSNFDAYTTISGASKPTPLANHSVQLWVGQGCDDLTTRNMSCLQLKNQTITDYDSIFTHPDFVLPIQPVIDVTGPVCGATQGSSAVWFLVDSTGTGTPLDSAFSLAVPFDKQPPPLPTNLTADKAEGAIQLSWDLPAASTSDILYFQALCQDTTSGGPVGTNYMLSPQYQRPADVCGIDQSGVPITMVHVAPSSTIDAAPPDGAPDGAPDGSPFIIDAAPPLIDAAPPDASPAQMVDPASFEGLNPAFLCKQEGGTVNSMRIQGLNNGTPYRVILLSIDKSGNAVGAQFIETITPQAVNDVWEDLHQGNSQVESGFCLISDTYGDGGPITSSMRAFRDGTLGATSWGRALVRFYYAHVAWLGAWARAHWYVRVLFAIVLAPLVVFALAWHVLTLPGLVLLAVGALWWRRRKRGVRRARLAFSAGAALLVLGTAGAARAQTPAYWDQDTPADSEDTGLIEATWIVGIKVGPYVPQIDAQFQAQTGSTARPYHTMFGGYNIMPMLEVDRVLLHDNGQLTAGIALGYLSKTANAYVMGVFSNTPDPQRSPGDSNSFRMIPVQLTMSYRLTQLDDRWGIPIVPYVRGGVAYYPWWITAPDGNFSYVGNGNCYPDTPTHMCTRERAVGGSAGIVGAIGIAIRAERIDPDTVQGMHDSGIAHAGFYGELQSGWVDSFGDSHRFSLGDTTFFGGVNFEF